VCELAKLATVPFTEADAEIFKRPEVFAVDVKSKPLLAVIKPPVVKASAIKARTLTPEPEVYAAVV